MVLDWKVELPVEPHGLDLAALRMPFSEDDSPEEGLSCPVRSRRSDVVWEARKRGADHGDEGV